MNYRLVTTAQPVINYLSTSIIDHVMRGERVLWLVSGGSNIEISVAVAKTLKDIPADTLFISLTDERFGAVGHVYENWQQLFDAGFSVPEATLYRPLIGKSRRETTEAFDSWLGTQLGQADYSIGLFGIGSDGHTAGIKPGSPSTGAKGWVTAYTASDFERITMTFDAIRRLDEVVVQTINPDKTPVIIDLLHADIPLDSQPAQVLKFVKKSTLFTDYKEIN